jgi:hypothetical protein
MAREAGFDLSGDVHGEDDLITKLTRLIELEREACAQVCEDHMAWGEINRTIAVAAGNCADLIRARGE